MDQKNKVQNVFIIGAKSLGAYGGYETFVNKLTEAHEMNHALQYHVYCKANGDGHMNEDTLTGVKKISNSEFIYHNTKCFKIKVPNIGPAQAIYYDLKSLNECCNYIEKNNIENAIVYILACRIGPFIKHFYNKIHRLGGKVFVNPDGHEWLRAKWSAPIRKYWKFSEMKMIKYSDLVVCDSTNIESYIHNSYDGKCVNKSNPNTRYIAYGADLSRSNLSEDTSLVKNWFKEKQVKPNNYYLIVGRFVPENSFETIIREYMESNSKKQLIIITTTDDKFLNQLENKLGFKKDSRIKFVGTVYNQELLKIIREKAYGYIHGHTVGGTNPSLIESLGSTNLNLLVNVGFNKEVAGNCALYWSSSKGSLSNLIEVSDNMDQAEIQRIGDSAKKRVSQRFTWEIISNQYEKLFLI